MEIPAVALFRLAYNELSREINAEVTRVAPDHKPAYGNVMEQLDIRDGQRLTDLARGAGMAPQSMGELVDQLEDLGMVERRPDPDDRRAKRIHQTDHGRDVSNIAWKAILGTEEKLTGLLGSERLRGMKADLVEVVEAFGGSVGDIDPQV